MKHGAEPRVLLLTDPRYDDEHVIDVAEVCADALGDAFGLVVRDLDRRAAMAAELVYFAHESWLFVKGAPDVAKAAGAHGVHLGSPPWDLSKRHLFAGGKWMGSLHDDADADRAAGARLDFALVSPIFASPRKGPPRGAQALASSAGRAPRTRHFALGGVGVAEAPACAKAGAAGVAVIRALFDAPDPAEVARALAAPFTARRTV
jgi:thiamine-phosphate pyrophosphorylase